MILLLIVFVVKLERNQPCDLLLILLRVLIAAAAAVATAALGMATQTALRLTTPADEATVVEESLPRISCIRYAIYGFPPLFFSK